MRQAFRSLIAIGGLTMWGFLALALAERGEAFLFLAAWGCASIMGGLVLWPSEDTIHYPIYSDDEYVWTVER